MARAKEQMETLCSKIRTIYSPKETVLFVIMGDIINASDTTAFADARVCLDCIKKELSSFDVHFEFVPGNHDLPAGDIEPFDRFVAEYGASCPFSGTAAFSKIYDDVNFIFADSNLARDHRLPGKIDIDAIRGEVKNKVNLLFCHHGFTHSFGGDHDVIENGSVILAELNNMGIQFAIHGHTHRADATIQQNGIVEIGCGTLFKDVSDMDGIPNQFSVGYINAGQLVRIERFVVPRDGGDVFPREALYPEQHMFADPNSIGKETYGPVCDYIPRTVLPHSSVLEEGYAWFFSKDKETALQNALLQDEKVLFLSDAGQGKSIEMENLAHNMGDTMYFPFLFKLRNYTGTAIDDLLPESYNKVPPHYLALLFDGYDELPEEYRRKFGVYLNLYVEKTPGVHVVISSRSNFCKSEKENESRTFPGFHIYDLCELTAENIDSYLQLHGIEPKQFTSEARRVGIRKMLTNAFYLTKVSALYQKNGTLPPKAELMDKLVEMCFDTDDAKFIEDLEGNYCELIRLLKRVAFAMQLLQQSKLDDRSEYQALFTNVERELLMHSGLIVKEGESWRFIHNNFREYLAAQYLAEMDQEQVISYISNDAGINPSWVNVLGYLTGISMSWDLIGWIAANAPNALVKYESDQVDPDTRFIIFTRIFNYYEEKRIWFRDELCNEEELANFSASDAALTFLLEKIANPVHVISQYTAVDILRHYRNLYGRQGEVLNCLINCCKQYPETRKDVCRLAIFAISQLDLDTPEVTQKLITLFQHTDSDYVRLGIYEYLVETKEQNEYVDFFLYGIRFISRELEWDNKRVGNEAFSLVDGLKSMSTVDSVSAVLKWFGKEKTVDFHDSDELFVTMTRKATMLYKEGAKGFFDIVLECCVKFLRGYDHEEVKTCVAFFQDTGTMEAAVLAAAQYLVNDIRHLSDMIYLCPEALGFIQMAYDEGRFNDHEAFRGIAVQHADDDDTYAKCSELIAVRTGLPLPVRGPRINHYLERRKGEYEYFEALFSKDKAEKMLATLLTAIGKPDILVKDLLRESMDLPWYSPLKSLKIAIYHGAPKEEHAADFFADLEFDRFTIVQCKKILSSKTEVVVSNKQKEHIKAVICHYLKQDVLKSEAWCKEGHVGVTTFVDALIFLLLASA